MEARPVQPDEPDSPPAPASLRDSNLMRSVNNNLRQRSEALPAAEPIAFFCECGSPTCYAPIWMTVASFEARVEDRPGWLLHTGHEPSALWHPREPVPTRTSQRAGSAAADPDLDSQGRMPTDADSGRSRHVRLTGLGSLLSMRNADRRRVKATHA